MKNAVLRYRRFFVLLVHLALWASALVLSFFLRFDFQVPDAFWKSVPAWAATILVVRSISFYAFGMFHGLWRYTSTTDVVRIVKATTLSTGAFALFVTLIGPSGFPRSIYLLDWIIGIGLVGGLRIGIRTLRELAQRTIQHEKPVSGRKRVLIVGAGDAGEMLARELRAKLRAEYEPIGFVDDDKHKHFSQIHGIPVLGDITGVSQLVKEHQIDEVVIAIPSATGLVMRKIVETCNESGAKVRTIPGVKELIDGKVHINQLRSLAIEDLLRRDPVVLESEAIRAYIHGKTVLVTGAGGSIGSELCRQICSFTPGRLILVERAENNLFQIHRSLSAQFPHIPMVPCIADITDANRLRAILGREAPTAIFHAAAHKHVPMMEWNPAEAIKNNVFGTMLLADLASEFAVEKFVMISTDKAVNPTSIMGATKRIAEIYVQALSQKSKTQFVTVRFGNVLGSAGSVVPIFQEQIAKGGPVVVTHPDMVRYFMTIPEASQLVLQAGTMGTGGEIFILDMGEPVKIVDLAKDLIHLSGFRVGEDIEISFSGMRPGEKLFEELSFDAETANKTRHPKIYVGKGIPQRLEGVYQQLKRLREASELEDESAIRTAVHAIVPEFQGLKVLGVNRTSQVPAISTNEMRPSILN